MKLKLCSACKGAKKVSGLGGITYKDCSACKGIGYLPDVEDAEIDAILQREPEPVSKPAEVVEAPKAPEPVVQARKTDDRTSTEKEKHKRSKAKGKTS